MFRTYLRTYSKKSTVHGVVYIGQPRSNIVEKLFWIVSLAVSLILTTLLISQLIGKLNKTPIVISLDDSPIRVSEIFFPSVTICPGFSPSVNFTDYNQLLDEIKAGQKNLTNFTESDLEYLQIVSLIAKDDYLSRFNLSIPTENFIDRLSDISNFFTDNQMNKSDYTYDKGNWTQKYHVNYTQIICKTGFCYTFNFATSEKLFNLEELSSDFNFSEAAMTFTVPSYKSKFRFNYPLKTDNADLGMYAKLSEKRRVPQFEPMDVVQNGFHLTFHHPFEIIAKDSPNYFALFNQTILFRIHPKKTSFDNSISMIRLEKRLCYLSGEKTLKYFKVYNAINCEHECLANQTFDACQCVQFFMVRNQSTKICGISEMKCFDKVERDFATTKSKCKCFESCDRLSYEVEVLCLNRNYTYEEPAALEVKFKENEIYQQIYKMQYSYTDLLAFIGGLLGLFAGLSALSVIEVVYIFSLRLMLQRCATDVHPQSSDTDSRSFWIKFMEQTGVHSFNFVVWEDSKTKKLFWIAAFALCIYSFLLMASESYRKFSLNAVATTQDNELMSVDEIPLPAITIVGSFEHSLHVLSEYIDHIAFVYLYLMDLDASYEEDYQLDYLNPRTMVEMFVCLNEPDFRLEKYPFNYTRHSDFVDTLMNISSSSQRLWLLEGKAKWEGNTNFIENLTPQGIGFTFNTFELDEMLNVKLVSDDFVRIQSETESSPKVLRGNFASSVGDFKISFTNNSHLMGKEENDECLSAGFFMHSPYEMPLIIKSLTKLTYGTSMEILVKPEVTKSDASLIQMDLKHRKCYFEGEYQLKYFKHYTKSHCDLEVLSAITFEKCGCVPFNYIRNASMDICDVSRWPCALRHTNVVFDGRDNTEFSRHCLPSCDLITYEYEFISSREKTNYSNNYFEEATLTVRFKDSEVTVLRRYQLYPAIAFLSNIGGLLGLFAGISFLTVLETFYLLVIRPTTDLTRRIFCRI